MLPQACSTKCGCGAHVDFQDDPEIGDDTVYIYYHVKTDYCYMTTVKGDVVGAIGSSAGFTGKLEPISSVTADKPTLQATRQGKKTILHLKD